MSLKRREYRENGGTQPAVGEASENAATECNDFGVAAGGAKSAFLWRRAGTPKISA